MLTKKKISVIPVAYMDEGNIVELYTRITKVMGEAAPDYEIIYVNDASPDKSQEVLEKLAKADKKLTVITHSRNFGSQNAFTTGMMHALGDAVVILDGDVQDPPELIPEFIEKWLGGYDIVYGVRERREESFGKIWESAYHLFYVFFNKLSFVKVPLDAGEFSLMDRKVVDLINSLPERDRLIRGLRAWVGFKQIGVPYVRLERFSGVGVAASTLKKKIAWARMAIVNFSFAPLEWVFNAAIISIFVALILILINILAYLFTPDANLGNLTLITVVVFIGSVQLIGISIIGEYLKRIFEEVKDRPHAITEKIINNNRKRS